MANLKPQEIIDNKCTQKPRLILLPNEAFKIDPVLAGKIVLYDVIHPVCRHLFN